MQILIIGDSGSRKINVLWNLIENQPNIDKKYLYAKDPHKAKYQYLINTRESVGIINFNDAEAFIVYSNDMRDVYKDINYYHPDKEKKILIVLDDMIGYMINNRRLDSIVTEFFIRGRNLNISLVFITQSYFKFQKDVRLNSTHFSISKVPNKRELQQVATNQSSDISIKDFIYFFKESTVKTYSFFVNDTTLASDNPLSFRKLFLKYNKNHDN